MSSFNTDLKQILHSSNVSGRSIDASQWRRVMACESKEELERAAISIALERDPVAESPKIRASPEKNKIVETKQQKQQQQQQQHEEEELVVEVNSRLLRINRRIEKKLKDFDRKKKGSVNLSRLNAVQTSPRQKYEEKIKQLEKKRLDRERERVQKREAYLRAVQKERERVSALDDVVDVVQAKKKKKTTRKVDISRLYKNHVEEKDEDVIYTKEDIEMEKQLFEEIEHLDRQFNRIDARLECQMLGIVPSMKNDDKKNNVIKIKKKKTTDKLKSLIPDQKRPHAPPKLPSAPRASGGANTLRAENFVKTTLYVLVKTDTDGTYADGTALCMDTDSIITDPTTSIYHAVLHNGGIYDLSVKAYRQRFELQRIRPPARLLKNLKEQEEIRLSLRAKNMNEKDKEDGEKKKRKNKSPLSPMSSLSKKRLPSFKSMRLHLLRLRRKREMANRARERRRDRERHEKEIHQEAIRRATEIAQKEKRDLKNSAHILRSLNGNNSQKKIQLPQVFERLVMPDNKSSHKIKPTHNEAARKTIVLEASRANAAACADQYFASIMRQSIQTYNIPISFKSLPPVFDRLSSAQQQQQSKNVNDKQQELREMYSSFRQEKLDKGDWWARSKCERFESYEPDNENLGCGGGVIVRRSDDQGGVSFGRSERFVSDQGVNAPDNAVTFASSSNTTTKKVTVEDSYNDDGFEDESDVNTSTRSSSSSSGGDDSSQS